MTAPGDKQVDDRPRNVDAEVAVLGACMLADDAMASAAAALTPDDFYRPPHQMVFAALLKAWENDTPRDPVSVASTLEASGELLRVGGSVFVFGLYQNVPAAVSAAYWVDIVADKAKRARLMEAATRVRQLAVTYDDDAESVQERARAAIEEATAGRVVDGNDGVWVTDAVNEHIASWSQPRPEALPLPYADLQEVTGGLRPGQLIVVAGRPGQGKSVFGTDCAAHAAEHKRSTLFVSLEMSRDDVLDRLIAATAGVRLHAIQTRTVDDFGRYRVEEARDRLERMPVRIEDRFSQSLSRVRTVARECKRGPNGLDLVIVDYLQLLTPADPRVARREQVDAFSRGLKALAKELSVPVIAIAQLNRGPEQRQDKKPLVSDLRESGSLEQDADMVILISRPDAYERDDPRAGGVDLIVAKQRNGPTGTVTVSHQLHYARFTDIGRERK